MDVGKYCLDPGLRCTDGTCQLPPCKEACAGHACAYVLEDKCVCGDVCSMDSDAGCGYCFDAQGNHGPDVTGVCDTCIAGDLHTCADLGKPTPTRACTENKDCCGSWTVPGSGAVPVAACWKGQCVQQIDVTCADLSAALYDVKKAPADFGCKDRPKGSVVCVPQDVDSQRPSEILCRAAVSRGNPSCPEKYIACVLD